MENFICPQCNKRLSVSKYRCQFDGDQQIFTDIKGKQLKCCTILIPIETEFRGFPDIGSFTLMSRSQKKNHLKQRSRTRPAMTGEEKTHREKNGLF